MTRRTLFEVLVGASIVPVLNATTRPIQTIRPFVVNGLPTQNGHRYPKSVWENATALHTQLRHSLVALGTSEGPSLPLGMICARLSTLEVQETPGPELYRVFAEGYILNTPSGKAVQTLIDSGSSLYLTPVGMGKVDEAGEVSDYGFAYWALTTTTAIVGAQPINNYFKIPKKSDYV